MVKTILILAANPKDTPRLRLDKEVNEIDNGLQRAKKREEFTLEQKWATTAKDIRRAMLDFNPNIVHFCGHGEGDAGIAFEDEIGNATLVDAETLADFFRIFSNENKIECVILNACYSEIQADAIVQHIDYVVGMKKGITDKAAISFAVAFYDALASGKSIEFSHELACNAIRWAGLPEHLTPILKSKKDGLVKNSAKLPSSENETTNHSTTRSGQDKPIDLYDSVFKDLATIIEDVNSIVTSEKSKTTHKMTRKQLTSISSGLDSCKEKLSEQCFQIAILALVKSGKSTLLNSWLGQEFLPTSNAPETAQIVRIRHNPEHPNGILKHGKKEISGVSNISSYIESINAKARIHNSRDTQFDLVLEAPFWILSQRELREQKFEILDTPGPNEAGLEFLPSVVDDLLEHVDVIIYLLDYTKLKTGEEQLLFEKLKEMRRSLVYDYSNRLFFVVNKIDRGDSNSLTLDETVAYVANVLNTQIPGLNVSSDRILLVSARDALLARLIQGDEVSIGRIQDFMEALFGRKYKGPLTIEACLPHVSDLLEWSRIQQLEDDVLSYIYTHRKHLFFVGVLDDVERQVQLLSNYFATISGTLNADRETVRTQINQLEDSLKRIAKRLENIGGSIEDYKKKCIERVEWCFEEFRKRCDKYIIIAFEEEDSAVSYDAYPAPISKTLKLIRKENIRYKIQSKDRGEVKDAIVTLSERISELVDLEFSKLEQQLHSILYKKQMSLIRWLESYSIPVLREIEHKVGESLNISLIPVDIEIGLPTRQEFLEGLEQDVDLIIQKDLSFKPRIKKKKLWGWLPWFKVELIEVQYFVSSENYKKYLRDQIGHMIDKYSVLISDLVDAQFGAAFGTVYKEIDTYSKSYIVTARETIASNRQEGEQKQARLQEVEESIHRLKGILSIISNYKTQLKQL